MIHRSDALRSVQVPGAVLLRQPDGIMRKILTEVTPSSFTDYEKMRQQFRDLPATPPLFVRKLAAWAKRVGGFTGDAFAHEGGKVAENEVRHLFSDELAGDEAVVIAVEGSLKLIAEKRASISGDIFPLEKGSSLFLQLDQREQERLSFSVRGEGAYIALRFSSLWRSKAAAIADDYEPKPLKRRRPSTPTPSPQRVKKEPQSSLGSGGSAIDDTSMANRRTTMPDEAQRHPTA